MSTYPSGFSTIEITDTRVDEQGNLIKGSKWAASDVNPLLAEIENIQVVLGLNPQGEYDTVDERIEAISLATQGPPGEVGPSGIGFTWKNTWVSDANYVTYDVVLYDGSSYVSIQNSLNKQPDTETAYWDLFAQRGLIGLTGPSGESIVGPMGPSGESIVGPRGNDGSDGSDGISFSWLGPYSELTDYVINDCTSASGNSYVCILANGPSSEVYGPDNGIYWQIMTSKGDTGATGATGATGETGPAGENGLDGAAGAATVWVTVPGTPTRTSNTVFTITDTSNANKYDLLLQRGTILKWTDTTGHMGMVVSATYATNTVTVTIVGDVLSASATMNTMKYDCMEKARVVSFVYAGTMSTGTDLFGRYHMPFPAKIFGADAYHATAGSTNATTYDINKGGTTVFSTKLSVASGATKGEGYTANDHTTAAVGDYFTVDCDSVSTTSKPIDAYINLFFCPLYITYLS